MHMTKSRSFYYKSGCRRRVNWSIIAILQWYISSHDISSPLWLSGDIRDMALLSFNNRKKMIVVSRNNDYPGVYSINVE